MNQLSQPQQKALFSLISGSTQSEAASVAGCSLRTMQRWAKLPAFRQALSSSVDVTMSITVSRLSSLSDLAIDTLQSVMQKESSTPAHKIRCANSVLNHVLRLAELSTVLNRIDELEARVAGLQSPQNDSSMEDR